MSVLETRRVDGIPPTGGPSELDLPEWVAFATWQDGPGPPDVTCLVLEVQMRSVSLDDLVELWQLFGTTKIDLATETRNIGGCETCDFEYEHATITVRAITRYPA